MIIGVAGGTGSGKTTIAKKLLTRLGESRCALLQQDSYYRNLSDIPLDERRRANFDHPDAVDFDAIYSDLTDLREGKPAKIPIYEFATHTRSERTLHLEPRPVVIIEGILIFSQQKIRDLIDLKIFINSPADIRLMRRIQRDINERGRTLDQTLKQYGETIRPMHRKFVAPTKEYADLIVPDVKGSEAAVEMLIEMVRNSPKGETFLDL